MDSEENTSRESHWLMFGKPLPKQEIVFFSQIVIIYIVVVCSIANLSLDNGDKSLWSTLLGSCLGYVLPNPSLKRPAKILHPA